MQVLSGGGTFYSHTGWNGYSSRYTRGSKQWTLVAPVGKRIRLKITSFYVS